MTPEDAVKIVDAIQEEVRRLDMHNSLPSTHNLQVVLPSESEKIRRLEPQLMLVANYSPLPVVDAMDAAISRVQGYTFSDALARQIEKRRS
jgi:hypothetical protein